MTPQGFLEGASDVLVTGGAFVATFLVLCGAYAFVHRRRLAEGEVVRRRLRDDLAPAPAAPDGETSIVRDAQVASGLGVVERVLRGRASTAAVQARLDSAGSGLTVGAFLTAVALAGATAGGLGLWAAGGLGALVLAPLGALAPYAVLGRQRAARARAFERQLPEALDMLVSAVRAGYSFPAAMRFVGDEIAAPLGPEFARVSDEQRLGVDARAALLNLQGRAPLLDVQMFVTALLVQRETGGNLAEIMSNLAALIRERAALRGQIDVLTAEPRVSAIVLTAIPALLFAGMNVLNPAYLKPLYESDVGRQVLLASGASLVVGYLAMRRISRIEL